MDGVFENVRADYESLRREFEVIRSENAYLLRRLNVQAKREHMLRELARSVVANLPDSELERMRSQLGHTNTSIIRRSVGLLAVFLGKKRFFEPQPDIHGYIPRDDDREWVEQKARELGIEIVEDD